MICLIKTLIVLVFFLLPGFSFSQQYTFTTYSIEQGLSQSVVNCIFQDSQGFIWVGTQHGLNKFNGYSFESYTFNPLDTHSISNNWIYSIDEDASGNLWVVTKGGLNEFIRSSKTFNRLHFDTGNKNAIDLYAYDAIVSRSGKVVINMMPVLVIYDPVKKDYDYHTSRIEYDGAIKDNTVPLIEDSAGLFWIGSTRGLTCFDPGTGKFSYFLHDPKKPNTLSNNSITALFEDRAGNIWIGTSNGLNVYQKKAGMFTKYFNDPKNEFSLSNNFIRAITEDKQGKIWIGTEGAGLNKLIDPSESKAIFEHFSGENSGIGHNIVLALKIDQSENLWIGTLKGISKTDLKKQKFRLYRKDHSPYSVNLLGNVIASIFKDDNGNIWVGNWGQGLNILDRKTGKVEHFSTSHPKNHHLVNDFVHIIFEDSEKRIWIGSRDGIMIYKKENNSFVRLKDFFKNPKLPDFQGLRINMIIQDERKHYWIATQNGLYKLNLQNGSTERFYMEAESDNKISANLVYSVLEDRGGMIWIATLNGLDTYNPATRKITHYRKVQGSSNSLSDNFVISLCEDNSGNIWIGTGSGVNKFVKKDSSFLYYSHENGLPNDQIFDILQDNNNSLWFTTGSGLSRYDSADGTFRIYTVEEGLQSLEFNMRAACKGTDGEVFFGGMNGFNSFYPDSLLDNRFIPGIVFSAFDKTNSKGLNERYDPEGLPEIVLNYNDYSFTLEFAALEFTHPEKNFYAYKMEGISDEWIEIGSRRFVPFSNLPPGEYIFTVKASNNDGVWNETGKSLKIVIKPPWWKSYPAYGSYILVLILLIGLYIKWRTGKLINEKNQLEEKVRERTMLIEKQKDKLIKSQQELDLINKELEQRVEERTAEYLLAKEKAESGDRLKAAFMHNISHEIRTPLNGILGFGQLMLGEDVSADEREAYFKILQRSSDRLMNTVTDYMDISLVASGNMEVHKKIFDPVHMLKEIYNRFLNASLAKNLVLTLQTPVTANQVKFNSDPELLSKVLGHLVDNGIKFTDQGSVTFGFSVKNDEPEFFVKDTGIGISPKDQVLVFERFAQADSSSFRAHEGSGLGLSIANELVELLEGSLSLESEKGEGAAFFFTVPVDMIRVENIPTGELRADEQGKPLILVAEDEESNSLLVAEILEKLGLSFIVVTDGKQAVEACRKNSLISLVLMDLKMPVMNGFEATGVIKTLLPNLPVIAITAYALSGDKKRALDAGCNDYLSKPISKEALSEKLKQFGVPTSSSFTQHQ